MSDLFGPCGKLPQVAVVCGRDAFHEGPCGEWFTPAEFLRDGDLPAAAHARRADPETSHEAAKEIRVTPRQTAVLECLRLYGAMTDPELERIYNRERSLLPERWPEQTPQSLRSRRAELVHRGEVKDTGRRGVSATGKQNAAKVWEAVDA